MLAIFASASMYYWVEWVWQYSFFFQNIQLRITVAEQHVEGDFSSIGHVIVGSQLSGTEVTHWNQMMTSLRKPIAMWHRLKK